MASERVVVELTVDAAGAAQGVAQFKTALDGAQAKAEQVQQATMKMLVGVPQSADRVSVALKRLQASLDPVTKAQFQMEREMTKSMALIERAVRIGVSTEQQGANIISAIRQKQVRELEAVRSAHLAVRTAAANQNQGGLARFGSLNATSQFQDIAITSAMGQSPLTIALQQGTQLGMALEQQLGDQGVKGVVKGLGSAFMGLLSPINLVAIGLTGAAAFAIQYFTNAKKEAKTLVETLKDQKKAIDDLAASYGLAEIKSQEFYRKSIAASESAARLATKATRDALKEEQINAIKQLGAFSAPAGGVFGNSDISNSPMARMIEVSVQALREANPDFDKLEDTLKGMVSQNPELQTIYDHILKIADAAHELASQLSLADKLLKDVSRSSVGGVSSIDRLREQGQAQTGLMRRMNPGAFGEPRNQVQEEIDASRRQQSLDADIMSMGARSPSQRASAARMREMSTVRSGEREDEFRDRVAAAGKLEFARAEHELAEAHRERGRALEETLASSRLDLELIGKTTGEQAALRMEFEKTQELRRAAAAAGIEVDQKELDLIHQKAVEYGKVAEAIQRTNLLRDVLFERDQLMRTPGEQSIASRLRGTGLGMDSDTANSLRYNQQFAEVKDGIKGFISDIGDALVNGGDDIGKALGKAVLGGLNKILDQMLEQVLNSLANAITSSIMGGGAVGGGGAAAFGTAGGFMEMLMSAGGGAARHVGGAGSSMGNFAGSGSMAQYAQAIKDIESSGGNYGALGPVTRSGDRAYGAYQVMGSNIPSWTRSALGHSMSPGDFLHDRGAQDAVFQQQFGRSISKFGSPQDAASVWFTGRPQGGSAGSARDILGTTGTQYVQKFNTALGKLSDTTSSVTRDVGALGKVSANATQGVGEFGNALSKFPSAPGGGGSFMGGAGSGGGNFGGGFPLPSFDFMSAISPLATASILSGAGGLFAKGGVFAGGNVIPFARGGVVSRPTLFPMANGAGLMGEAGEEAVMPLRRGSNGRLGVEMHGGGSRVVVNVINNGAPVSVEQRDTEGGVDVILNSLESHIAKRGSQPGTPMSKMLEARNARPALKRYG